MFVKIFIGSFIISLSIIIHATFIAFSIKVLQYLDHRFTALPFFIKSLGILIVSTHWLLAAHSLSIWLWATMFLLLGLFDTLESALYFSITSYTTLGFGDIILESEWRILSGMAATNGLLLFGFSTAFLFEAIARHHKAHVEKGATKKTQH